MSFFALHPFGFGLSLGTLAGVASTFGLVFYLNLRSMIADAQDFEADNLPF